MPDNRGTSAALQIFDDLNYYYMYVRTPLTRDFSAEYDPLWRASTFELI